MFPFWKIETMDMLDHMQIEFKERFPIASQEEKEKIKTCLDSIICLSQQSSAAKSCSQLEQQCVINISPQFPETETTEIYFQTELPEDRIALLGMFSYKMSIITIFGSYLESNS